MKKTFAMLMVIVFIFSSALAVPMPMVYADPFRSIEKEVKYAFIPDDLQQDVDRPITRVEFCRVIIDLYEYLMDKSTDGDVEPIKLPTNHPFTDTKDTAVLKAHSLGVIEPDENGRFHPKDNLTMQEKAVMLYNLLLLLNPDIDDAVKHDADFADEEEIGLWAIEAINYLNKNGIIEPDENNEINPDDNVRIDDSNVIVDKAVKHHTADKNAPTNYLVFGYHVINNGPINAGDINMRAPILDEDLLDATDYVKSSKFHQTIKWFASMQRLTEMMMPSILRLIRMHQETLST